MDLQILHIFLGLKNRLIQNLFHFIRESIVLDLEFKILFES